jgi:flotillin
MATFRVACASECRLASTGWGIDDVKLAKKAWVWGSGIQQLRFVKSRCNFSTVIHRAPCI